MTYEEWLAGIPRELSDDPLWQMKVYRFAVFAGDLAWSDTSRLASDKKMLGVADQLYRAVGSIAANIAEGYSHRSGRNQAHFYEYALGSAREAHGWYYQGRHLLGEAVTAHRLQLLTETIRQLLAIIPAQRGSKIKEESVPYEALPNTLLDNPPIP